MFIHLYNFLYTSDFFDRFQSGFRPGNSPVQQLMYIVHKIYVALEKGNEVSAVFLDISKVFDRVWHRGLLVKLSSIGVEGNLLTCFACYLSDRKGWLSKVFIATGVILRPVSRRVCSWPVVNSHLC